MRAHAGLILFIVSMAAAVAAVGVYQGISDDTSSQSVTDIDAQKEGIRLTQLAVYGVQDNAAKYVSIELTADSGSYNLSDAVVEVQTMSGVQRFFLE